MTSTFTNNLNLQLQGTGDNSGTWGSILNSNVIALVDQALGSPYAANVAGNSDVTLSTVNAGNLIHNLTGVLTGNINYIFPASAGRFLIIKNATTGAFTVTVKPAGGTGIIIPQGATQLIYIDSSSTTATTVSGDRLLTEQSVASATTTDLGTSITNIVSISGTTTVTSFGSSSTIVSPIYFIRFTGALTLTYNATSLIIPGASNITTAAGDTAIVKYEGSGNWRVLSYTIASSGIQTTPSGIMSPYAGSAAPTGWILCYGQAISRTAFSALFTAISTTYGIGDGTTTFNVPDMRGRIAAGVDNMGGSAASRITNAVSGITGTTLGASGGDQNLHDHTHTATVTDPGHFHNTTFHVATGGGLSAASATNTSPLSVATDPALTGITVANSTTGTGASQNIQPTIMLNYIIKT
jgi:microcystin-dependent protein